jgi:hypothetical protein
VSYADGKIPSVKLLNLVVSTTSIILIRVPYVDTLEKILPIEEVLTTIASFAAKK